MKIRNDVTVTYHKIRKRWLVRWSGKYNLSTEKQPRLCKTFKLKRQAEQFALSLKQDREDGIIIEPKAVSLKNLCNNFIVAKKGNFSPETINTYEQTISRLLSHFGSHRNIKTISNQEAHAFINNLEYVDKEGKLSDCSRLKHLTNCKALFNYAINSSLLRSSPFSKITINNRAKEDWHFIPPKEFNALIAHTTDLRLKTMYSAMYGTGLRFGECIHLWWDKNIDFVNNQIHIKNRKSKDGFPPFRIKNYHDRSIDCPKWVMDLLTQLKKVSNSNNPYVFITNDRLELLKHKWAQWQKNGKEGEWVNAIMVNNTNRNFRVHCRKAGIVTSDKLSIHTLRKGYGTNLADLGTPPHTIKSLMGHSSINTTMTYYIKTTDENKKKAVKGLEDLMNKN